MNKKERQEKWNRLLLEIKTTKDLIVDYSKQAEVMNPTLLEDLLAVILQHVLDLFNHYTEAETV